MPVANSKVNNCVRVGSAPPTKLSIFHRHRVACASSCIISGDLQATRPTFTLRHRKKCRETRKPSKDAEKSAEGEEAARGARTDECECECERERGERARHEAEVGAKSERRLPGGRLCRLEKRQRCGVRSMDKGMPREMRIDGDENA